MPTRLTDRDPQEAYIGKAPEVPPEVLLVFEIARQVNEKLCSPSVHPISPDLIFQIAVEMAFKPVNLQGLSSPSSAGQS
jgi:hypothetical protein